MFRCGPGNTANDYDDLGNDEEVDKCCRDHDHCDNIASGEEKYGLKNDDFFTRLHCQCDKEFKSCLTKVIIVVSLLYSEYSKVTVFIKNIHKIKIRIKFVISDCYGNNSAS